MDEWPSTVGVLAPRVKAGHPTRGDIRVPSGDAALMTEPTTTTPPPIPTAEAIERLRRARTAIDALRPRIEEGEPWPLAEDFGVGPEASWGPREVLAHTAEMLPFWQGEMERVIEAARPAGDPLPYGRVAADAMRLGILERDRTLPLRELFDRIATGITRWESRTETLTPEEGSARGLHVRDGELPATWIRDRFVIRHLEEHVAQLEEILGREGSAR
jgi:hypothetical protein